VYSEPDGFGDVEATYRRGFAAALEPAIRGQSFEAASEYLQKNYPEFYREESFRLGFERGQHYFREKAAR
jgi:hypothetical protein